MAMGVEGAVRDIRNVGSLGVNFWEGGEGGGGGWLGRGGGGIGDVSSRGKTSQVVGKRNGNRFVIPHTTVTCH